MGNRNYFIVAKDRINKNPTGALPAKKEINVEYDDKEGFFAVAQYYPTIKENPYYNDLMTISGQRPKRIYKTKADYYNKMFIPTIIEIGDYKIGNGKYRIDSFKPEQNADEKDKYKYPTKLSNGYLLWNYRNEDTNPTNKVETWKPLRYTIDEYYQLEHNTIINQNLLTAIIDDSPFTEVWNCGNITDKSIAELVKANNFSHFIRVL